MTLYIPAGLKFALPRMADTDVGEVHSCMLRPVQKWMRAWLQLVRSKAFCLALAACEVQHKCNILSNGMK